MSNFGYIKYFAERYKNKKSTIEEQYKVLYKISKFINLNFPKFVKERFLWVRRMSKLDTIINMEMYYKEAWLIDDIMEMLEECKKMKSWKMIDDFLNEYMGQFFQVNLEILVKRCEKSMGLLDQVIDIQTILISKEGIGDTAMYAVIEGEEFFSKTKALRSDCENLKEEIILRFSDTSTINWDVISQLNMRIYDLEHTVNFVFSYNRIILTSLQKGLTDPSILAIIQSLIS